MKLKRRDLRRLIESFIAGKGGVLHVPEVDPYEDDSIVHPSVRAKVPREAFDDPENAENFLTLSSTLHDRGDRDIGEVDSADEYYSMQRAMEDPLGEYDRLTGLNPYDNFIEYSGLDASKYFVEVRPPSSKDNDPRWPKRNKASIYAATREDAEVLADALMNSPMREYDVANRGKPNSVSRDGSGILDNRSGNSSFPFVIHVFEKIPGAGGH